MKRPRPPQADAILLRSILEKLIEWDAGMGGHQSRVWADARAAYKSTSPKADAPTDGPENTNQITAFFHCRRCFEEQMAAMSQEGNPPQMSPADYARIEVGWTKRGFQVWCRRHDANIVHVDFEGIKHRANTTQKEEQP